MVCLKNTVTQKHILKLKPTVEIPSGFKKSDALVKQYWPNTDYWIGNENLVLIG